MCFNKRNIFYKRSISIKQFWLEIIEKIGCSKSVRPSTVIYIMYITRTDFEHHFSQLFRVRVVLSRWTFYKKCFFCWGMNKMLFIQNWWTIPLICNPRYPTYEWFITWKVKLETKTVTFGFEKRYVSLNSVRLNIH